MQVGNDKRDTAAIWFAVFTPVVILLAGILLIGLPLVPLICIYGDGRSRRPTGIVTAGVLGILYFILFGRYSILPIVFLTISTAVPYFLWKRGYGLRKGVVATLLASLVAAMLCFALASAMTGRDPAGTLGTTIAQQYTNAGEEDPVRVWGDSFLASMRWMEESDTASVSLQDELAQVRQTDITQRAQDLHDLAAGLALTYLPALTLVLGIVTGLLSWYVPLALLSISGGETRRKVPSLGQMYIPWFLIFALVGVTLLCWLLYRLELGVSDGMYLATFAIMYMVMVVQGIIMTSYLLGRSRLAQIWQILIIAATVLLFHTVYVWVGIFETLFSLRLGMSRMDYLRARGVDPTSSEAQDLIRQHDEEFMKKMKDQEEEDKR